MKTHKFKRSRSFPFKVSDVVPRGTGGSYKGSGKPRGGDGQLLFTVLPSHRLRMSIPDDETLEAVREAQEGRSRWPLPMLIEYHITNGWQLVAPEQVGALVDDDRLLITDTANINDDGDFAFDYQKGVRSGVWATTELTHNVRGELNELLEYGYIDLDFYPAEKQSASRKRGGKKNPHVTALTARPEGGREASGGLWAAIKDFIG